VILYRYFSQHIPSKRTISVSAYSDGVMWEITMGSFFWGDKSVPAFFCSDKSVPVYGAGVMWEITIDCFFYVNVMILVHLYRTGLHTHIHTHTHTHTHYT